MTEWKFPSETPRPAEGILRFRSVEVWAELEEEKYKNITCAVVFYYSKSTWFLRYTNIPVTVIRWRIIDDNIPENLAPEYAVTQKRTKKFNPKLEIE